MNDIIYWVWLAQKNGAGSSDAVKLLEYFPGGARDVYEATKEQLSACRECSSAFLRRLGDHDLTRAEQTLEFCFMNGIRVVPCNSKNYPRRLNDLYNKPIVLYIRGMIEDLNERFCVSIVGTRSMSAYGKHMTFTLARQLIAYGAIVISGAAYGIDSAANNTAVFMEEPTVAVLGSGVNVPYPAKNKDMLDYIASHGMVISEFEPNTPPYGKNFPIRNRIISGLADAVIIVEAGEHSGALITARYACDQGRRVFAVPGNVGAPNSVGTNYLIRDGAKLVTCAEDIIEDFADMFDLTKIDRIIKSEKYLRYEYNHSIPVHSDNKPISTRAQDKTEATKVPPIKANDGEAKLPDVPNPSDYSGAAKAHGAVDTPPKKRESAPAKRAKTQKNAEVQSSEPTGQNKTDRERVMSFLDETQRRVFDAIPEGKAISADKIVELGISTKDALAALTMLELYSAVEALPGGLYRKII